MKKEELELYPKLMKQKFDLEDRMAKIGNERWRLNNENTKCGQQLRLVEDELRVLFDRMRIEMEGKGSEK